MCPKVTEYAVAANETGNVIVMSSVESLAISYVPHCVYMPMDNQYARSKEVNAESGAATVKANPLSITCLAYTSNVDTPGAE